MIRVNKLWKAVRRIAVIVAGSAVLLVGIAMLVLPGPAVIVIPLGVSILAMEVPIARRIMRKAKLWITRQRKHHAPAAKRLWNRVKGLVSPVKRHPPRAAHHRSRRAPSGTK